MDNMEAVKILRKARDKDIKLEIELSTGSKVYGKVINITPFDERSLCVDDWPEDELRTPEQLVLLAALSTCVVKMHRVCLPREGWIQRYSDNGMTNYVSVDQIANIHFHGY